MTIEERLREVLFACDAAWPESWVPIFQRELSARGLAVCEKGISPAYTLDDASSNGRTAPFEGVNAGSTPAASTNDREEAIARVIAKKLYPAIIASDPVKNLRAEVERLRAALEHFSRAVSGQVTFSDDSITDVVSYSRKALTEKQDG